MEAFSTGTPVIAAALGGVKEIVTDRFNGLHFEPGNAQDLVARIIALRDEAGLAERLSLNARSTYLRFYTPSKNYDLLIGLYDRVIRQRAGESKLERLQYRIDHGRLSTPDQ